MTLEEKVHIFKALLEFSNYEYKFLLFLESKINFIELKLSKINHPTEISILLKDLYQYYLEK